MVESAQELAALWRVPPVIIGLSVVAIGTSLPELATTLAAVRRRQGDFILGNVIGSNLANILVVFGMVALLAPGDISSVQAYKPMLLVLLVSNTAACRYNYGQATCGPPAGRALAHRLRAVHRIFLPA